jgi:HPt (histidine-containing phosphotransfer) domain-containing protein
MSRPLIDTAIVSRLAAIAERTGDDDLIRSVIDLYVEHTPPLLEGLERAVVGNDPVAAKRIAHRLKGSSLSIGAAAIGQLCIQVEALCTTAPFDVVGAQALIAAMNDLFERTVTELREHAAALRAMPPSSTGPAPL